MALPLTQAPLPSALPLSAPPPGWLGPLMWARARPLLSASLPA
jgi:hypothetical protein